MNDRAQSYGIYLLRYIQNDQSGEQVQVRSLVNGCVMGTVFPDRVEDEGRLPEHVIAQARFFFSGGSND